MAAVVAVPSPDVLYLVFRGKNVTHYELDVATNKTVVTANETITHQTPIPTQSSCLEPLPGELAHACPSIGCVATSLLDEECWFEFRVLDSARHQLVVGEEGEASLTDKLDLSEAVHEMQHEAGPMQALLQHRRLMRHVLQPDQTFFTRLGPGSVSGQQQPAECALCERSIRTTGCRDLPPHHARYGTETTTCQCKRLKVPCASNCVAVACVPCGHMYSCGACALQTSVLHQDYAHNANAHANAQPHPPPVLCNVCAAPVWHFVSVMPPTQ